MTMGSIFALRKADGRYSIPEDHFFVSDQIIRELI